MKFLQHHPFAIKAHLDQSLVLAYAVPAEELRPHMPEQMELDLYEGKYAFIVLAMVETRELRHAFLPKFMGRSFTLLGYRAFVRYQGADGRRRRGLYILRSETNSPLMTFGGNIFTQYNYKTVSLDWEKSEDGSQVIKSNLGLHVKTGATNHEENVALPKGSPFPDWRTARRFAGPMPFTFTHDAAVNKMVSVEGVRSKWDPKPVEILEHKVPFIDQFDFSEKILANAFVIHDVPYMWKKGVTEDCP